MAILIGEDDRTFSENRGLFRHDRKNKNVACRGWPAEIASTFIQLNDYLGILPSKEQGSSFSKKGMKVHVLVPKPTPMEENKVEVADKHREEERYLFFC